VSGLWFVEEVVLSKKKLVLGLSSRASHEQELNYDKKGKFRS
jgi:hypothetical protein